MKTLSPPMWEYHVILPHFVEPRLLLLPDADGWVLPHWQTTNRKLWQEVSHINQGVTERFGAEVSTLRLLQDFTYLQDTRYINLYELENHNPGWIPLAEARWVSEAELAELPLAYPEQRAILQSWFAALSEGASAKRPAWAQRGWFDTAVSWIMTKIRSFNLTAISTVEQLRTWERSCVLRINTDRGYFYFKAVPSWFAHEFRIIELFRAKLPESFLGFLAYDEARNWVLMHDFGGQSLDTMPDIIAWEMALRRFAKIQQYSISFQPELLAMGCPHRPIEELTNQVNLFFNDLQSYTQNHWNSLSQADIQGLQALVPRLKEMMAKLAAFSLPMSLEHGDLWPGNVIATSTDYLFFDWSDSSISHPFFSLWLFLDVDSVIDEQVKATFAQVPNLRNRLRDAYLSEWLKYISMEQLIEAFELAQQLAPLHSALTYHLYILPNMQARWQMESMVVFYLKLLL